MAQANTDVADVVDAASAGMVDSSSFTNLPFELVIIIITAAARDRASPSWAASLALLCRAIRNAVEPVLVETLRMTDTNCNAIARQTTRFQQTRHINVIFTQNAGDIDELDRFRALLGQRFSCCTAVTLFSWGSFCCRQMLLSLPGGSSATLSHLHIRFFPLFYDGPANWLPSSVTHLTLDPPIRDLDALATFIRYISDYLEVCGRDLKRLLFRTPCTLMGVKTAFVGALVGVAVARRDTRLWIDDDRASTDRNFVEYATGKEVAMDEDLGISLWYAGRQLYVPS
ncbi:hypothetical protein EXIGLDRAFT_842932 [Exidia glandulosa HHB12029]|uniref:F-box domain-containing protein n=1 Tax=Exidia glandulosa HHB12029 TaxID=1314781 RepID=A0A165ZKB0_EXIGL|nr:hypothetical protein EXIGLDRAFT_842932 [Exidia glandulosa HHB12029]